jgi:Lysyl oxidase
LSIGVLPPRLLKHLHGGVDLKPGRYTAIVSVTQRYRRLFAIPSKLATVRVGLRVIPGRRFPLPRRPVVVHKYAARRLSRLRAVADVADPDPATLPNLVALPAWRIGTRHTDGRDLLTFSATIWNAGPAPFSIEGYRRWGTNVMSAFEYFFGASGNAVGRAPAGTMFYDNDRGHHHWHLRQIADYRLIGRSGQVVRSHKQPFCIAPTDAVDLTVPRAALSPVSFVNLGFSGNTCDLYAPGSIWIREQLVASWGDTYTRAVAGQAFDITRVPNGNYRIAVRVNPLGVLHETTTRDDIAVRKVRLSGRSGARTVRVSPWHGING